GERIDRHAPGKLRRIAQYQNIAMRIGGHRGQGGEAEVVGNFDIGEREVVGQALLLLPVLLQAADTHGLLDLEAARALGSLRAERCYRIDEAPHMPPIGDEAGGHGITERKVERASEIAPFAAVTHALEGRIGQYFELAEHWLARDVAHRTGLRAGAEERPLWTAQHLESVEVEELEVGREERDGDGRLIEIDAHLLLDTGLVANHLARAYAADCHLALAGAKIRNGETRHVAGEIDDIGGP